MAWLIGYCYSFWKIFSAMAPWLLAGYLAAGVIAYFLKPEQVKKHFGGRGAAAVLKAVLIGIPLPVCSCGIIPIATALRNEGAGKGATGAFFISTPQIGVDSAIVTASMLLPSEEGMYPMHDKEILPSPTHPIVRHCCVELM